ncbi:hypothetical protein DM02DRAFT_139530 [Periconia macrospinosa]|uniref:Uncharacterized protein n=1 Tax=Periconia macrospinosa TaxID=97972 RepID=A0A2V1DC91_9PLEO|nr:hypothetical protein DM02DRAFT_139530 [Periconia macrospinosa]
MNLGPSERFAFKSRPVIHDASRRSHLVLSTTQPPSWFQTRSLCSQVCVTGRSILLSRLVAWSAAGVLLVCFDSVLTFEIAASGSLCTIPHSTDRGTFYAIWSCICVFSIMQIRWLDRRRMNQTRRTFACMPLCLCDSGIRCGPARQKPHASHTYPRILEPFPVSRIRALSYTAA